MNKNLFRGTVNIYKFSTYIVPFLIYWNEPFGPVSLSIDWTGTSMNLCCPSRSHAPLEECIRFESIDDSSKKNPGSGTLGDIKVGGIDERTWPSMSKKASFSKLFHGKRWDHDLAPAN